jgi:hypothetical protein
VAILLLAPSFARAELPLARLVTVFPPGGQRGTKVEVTLTGHDLDGADRLLFSNTGITAVRVATGSRFLVSIDSFVPPGLYDVRAAGLFGVSNPRTFEVIQGNSIVGKGANTSPETAIELPAGSSAHCVAEANAEQIYRVRTNGRQPLTIDVSTTALESKMEPIAVVSDSNGHELGRSRLSGDRIRIDSPSDGICYIRVHDLLYRGGAECFYRVRALGGDDPQPGEAGSLRWPLPPAAAFLPSIPSLYRQMNAGSPDPSSSPKNIDPPCEIDRQFRTAKQKDAYTFDVPAGGVYWIEIISHRLGQDTSPFFLVQRLERDEKGGEKVTDVQEVYASAPPRPVPEFPLDTRDPIYRLEAKQAGTYRLLVRDLFARDRTEHPAAYRLVIRRETPDFELMTIPPSPPPEPADSKDVPLWTTLLRRGGTAPIKVIAVRRDGFTGPIVLHVEGLPPDVTAGPAIIPQDATEATILLQADEHAGSWVGPITITGASRTEAGELSRTARPGTVSFSEYDAASKALVRLRSRLSDQFVVGVSDLEASPISIAPTQTAFEAQAGGKVTFSFNVKGRAPFTSPIVLNLAGHPAAAKQLTVDPKSDKASAELDLAQAKLPPGRYSFFFIGQTKIKYPDSPDLRAAKIAQMNAETQELALAERASRAAGDLAEAIRARNVKLTIRRAKTFLSSEMPVLKAEQALAVAEARVNDVAAHAPAADVNTSIFTGGFELNVVPPVAK